MLSPTQREAKRPLRDRYDEDNPDARGDDWSLPASALANAVAAIKALKRGRPEIAAELLERAYARLDAGRRDPDWMIAVDTLAQRAAGLEPDQASAAARVQRLARCELTSPASAAHGGPASASSPQR